MKTYFSIQNFSDKHKAALDGPDGWARGWVLHGSNQPTTRGVMFWVNIIGSKT